MLRLRVDIFEYLDGVPPVSILIHGYVQTTKAWTRCGVTVLAGSAVSDLPVRFGADVAGNLCIWLGDTTKSWSYPSVTVAEVLAKYNTSGATVAAWGVGWKVEPVTALETVLQTLAGENLAFARADIARVSGLQDALDLKANTAVTMVAGNGLSGGGTLSANRTFALGTPGKLTAVSTNAVTTASHTHELDTQTGKMDATAGRILLVGAFGIGAENPLDTNDLNTITIPGKYGQSANPNATFARNYPIANAGTLDVSMAGTYIVTQTYTAFSPLRVFVRARTSPTVWSAWTELASVDQAASAAPAGLTGFFAQSSAPVGWLKANGTAASVAAYPDLVNAIYRGDASNATAPFGYRCTNAANPSGTRNVAGSFIVLPDLRGEFVRGWDDARGIDPTRSYGTAQQDVFREHIHSYGVYTGGDGGGRVIAGGYENGNNHSDVVIGGVGSAMNSLGQFIGGSETRPRNVALLACIKY
ncbi:hypothetical protein HG262_17720 [Achromobacter sp. Bel]|nr:hypothetical protein [Achromobacter sp. Bel]